MNDLLLYEKIPEDKFPIRLLDYTDMPYSFNAHWHEHTEIHYIFNGTAALQCGDELVELEAGDCAIINSNELHSGESGICSYGCMILPPYFFEDHWIVFERVVRSDTVSDLFARIYSALRADEYGGRLEIKGYTYLLVTHLARKWAKEVLSRSVYARRSQKQEKINTAIKYINDNFAENITTSTLSRLVHLSEGYFCNVFKETMGLTATEYINGLRVKKAADLLAATDMSVTEAALCSGFSDLNYFSRVFKKRMGFTPNSVRKNK